MTDWERTGFLFAHRPSIPSRIHRSFPNRLPSERGPFRRRRLPFQNGSRWQEPAGFFVSMGPTVSDARRGTSLWSHPPHVDPFPRRSSSDGAPILPSFPPSRSPEPDLVPSSSLIPPGAGPCHVAPPLLPPPPCLHRYLSPPSRSLRFHPPEVSISSRSLPQRSLCAACRRVERRHSDIDERHTRRTCTRA